MSTRIIICRHGNTFDKGDVVTRVGARTDLPLSQSGLAQAEKLKAYFDPKRGEHLFEQAYCSELRRTHHTAQEILNNLHPAKLFEVKFLKEIDYGIDENKPETQIRADWRAFLKEMAQTPGDVLVVTSNGIARFVLDVVDNMTCEVPSIKLATAAFGIISCVGNATTVTHWNIKAS